MLSIGLGLLELFVALGISKVFDRVWHVGLPQKLNSYGIAGLSYLSIYTYIITSISISIILYISQYKITVE